MPDKKEKTRVIPQTICSKSLGFIITTFMKTEYRVQIPKVGGRSTTFRAGAVTANSTIRGYP